MATARSIASAWPESTTCAGIVVVGDFANLRPRPRLRPAPAPFRYRRRAARTSRPRPPARRLHRLPAQRSSRAVSASEKAPTAHSAVYSPSECPATQSPFSASATPPSFSSTRSVAMALAMIAGWAFSVRVSSVFRPFAHDREQLLVERLVDFLEHFARGGAGFGKLGAHADLLAALAGKDECSHVQSPLCRRGPMSRVRRSRKTEGHDPVGRIVADIGPAKVGNAAALAPVAGDFLRARAERPVVFRHVADPPSRSPAMPRKCCGDVEEQPVDRIEMLARLPRPSPHGRKGRASDRVPHSMASVIRLKATAGPSRRATARAQRPSARKEPSTRRTASSPPSRRISTGHRPVHRLADPCAIERAQQVAGSPNSRDRSCPAPPALSRGDRGARRSGWSRSRPWRTTRHRQRGSLAHSSKRIEPRGVVAGEMAVRLESIAGGKYKFDVAETRPTPAPSTASAAFAA